MSRDIQDRLTEFSPGGEIIVERIALTMEQIKRFNPPPNPAKLTDSRCAAYIEQYGNKSWELDALPVEVMHKLIVDSIQSYVDDDRWDEVMEEEKAGQEKIRRLAKKLD